MGGKKLLLGFCHPIGRHREVGRGKWGEEAGRVVAFIIEIGVALDDSRLLYPRIAANMCHVLHQKTRKHTSFAMDHECLSK